MGTTPRELTGTAVARPNDPASQLEAYGLAVDRLQKSADALGVFIGTPRFDVTHAKGRGDGYTLIIVTAPILETGTDKMADTAEERTEDR